ncbi:MAG TPA: MMPL family transporter [Xanthobacteraceae bacterium]|nr:MMPL family transporter [Xanthobacteraceae bacterium]
MIFARLTAWCIRHTWVVILATLFLTAGSADYVARHFAINTDVSSLISPNLPWRKRELAFQTAFPQEADSILVIIQGPTPELADAAAKRLTSALASRTRFFRSVREEAGGKFFEQNALLYLPRAELGSRLQKLTDAAPLIRMIASDPSLRGLAGALKIAVEGAGAGRLENAAPSLNRISDTLDNVLSGQPATFSWRAFVNGAAAKPQDLVRVVDIWPVLNYHALEPGRPATDAVRQAVNDAKLKTDFGASVLLTGPVPLADQEFASLREGVWQNAAILAVIALLVLWFAMRSLRSVAAIAVTLVVGLVTTAAFGLLIVGPLNPISVAFSVLFVGLGADFAIQFAVRYRVERHSIGDLSRSLTSTARYVGGRLLLAAGAAAAGFLSFVPTSYHGVAELGLIAGIGMAIAYVESMTLLPVLLRLFRPPCEPAPLDNAALAGADRFLQRHRRSIVVGTSLVVIAALPSLVWLQFDFNPMNLRKSNSEAILALRQLSSDAQIDLNAAEVLTSPANVEAVSKRLLESPEVAHTTSLDSFIPDDQQEKRQLIANAAATLDPALTTVHAKSPSDAENIADLRGAAKALQDVAAEVGGEGAQAAGHLARDLTELAASQPDLRRKADTAFVRPLSIDLRELRQSLQPQQVTLSSLPGDVIRDWKTPAGRIRIDVAPKGNANNSATLVNFARAVLSTQPDATGPAIETYEWGQTIIVAFIEAGAWALCSIAILLWVALRRVGDVLLTLIPLLVAAVAALEICGVTGFALNYANIIALPALLGIGVAFKIYYVIEWRAGETNFLQSTITRAVFFSALMTATAFGSLWLSNQPGISSMGLLLALSLACTLASAALFQPALMGAPRSA